MSKLRLALSYVKASLEQLTSALLGGRSVYQNEIDDLTEENDQLRDTVLCASEIVSLLTGTDTRGAPIVTVKVNDAFTRELLNHHMGNFQLSLSGQQISRLSIEGVEFH